MRCTGKVEQSCQQGYVPSMRSHWPQHQFSRVRCLRTKVPFCFEPGEVLPAPLPERVNVGVVERACAYAEAVLFFTQVWATRNPTQH